MPEVTFSYQVLMNAVFAGTNARASVYPNNHDYIALPQAEVSAEVKNFDSRICTNETLDSHCLARRLWYKFKEYSPLCACGIVRLMAPISCDLVGIVTVEDLLGIDQKLPKDTPLREIEMLVDDLSELPGSLVSSPVSNLQLGGKNIENPIESLGWNQNSAASNDAIEMTLIEPQTKHIFKKSQGGVFGIGKWPVSEIRAFAVWF